LDEYLQQTVVCSEQELKETFQTHGERYGRGAPHFKGAVIHARTKKTAKAIKKYLKKYPEALWQEAVRRMPDELKRECLVEAGLFPIGANPYVDKLAFKCGEYSPLSDYPYVDLIGKRLKKGPADYRDVREKLEKECLNGKKMAQMEAFMQKYAVEIDKEVLKTVNHADI
jgi:peptidyl-prolyl cis-trans isomerase SurA